MSFRGEYCTGRRSGPNIGDNIKKTHSLDMDDGNRQRLQKRSELQQHQSSPCGRFPTSAHLE
jgi:hypothetical protein